MKKILLLYLSFLLILLFGCAEVSEAEAPRYQAYELYYMEASNNRITAPRPTKLPLGANHEHENLKSVTIDINGETLLGTYSGTSRSSYKVQLEPIRYYDTKYGKIGFWKESKGLVSVWFSSSEKMLELERRYGDVLEITQCQAVATDFIKAVCPEANLESYVFTQSDLTEEDSLRFYTFTYERSFQGMATDDHIGITVSEHGNILHFERGSAINNEKLKLLNIDYVRIDELIEVYASKICQKKSETTYEVQDSKICCLDNGAYAWYVKVIFVYSDTKIEDELCSCGDTDFIQIVIPLETL